MLTFIEQAELDALWQENSVDAKREAGLLTEILAHSAAAKNQAYAGGESRIVVLRTASGQHIGTLHEIRMPDGSVPHRHPKDYTLPDCNRVAVR